MKTAKDARKLLASIAQDSAGCLNAHALNTLLQTGETKTLLKKRKRTQSLQYSVAAQQLISEFCSGFPHISVVNVKANLYKLYNTDYQKLLHNCSRNWEDILLFAKTEFIFQKTLPYAKDPKEQSIKKPPSAIEVEVEEADLACLNTQTRSFCEKATCLSAKKTNENLYSHLKFQKKRISILRRNTALIKKLYKPRTVNQQAKRQRAKLKELVETCSDLRQYSQKLQKQTSDLKLKNASLIKDNRSLLKQLGELNKQVSKFDITVQEYKSKFKDYQKQENDSKAYIHYLQSQISDTRNVLEPFPAKRGNMYSSDVRTCIYKALLCDVPVQHCGDILNTFAQVILGQNLSNVPSRTVCAQMAYELGILASVQVTEFLLSQNPLCLSWDATTVDGAHVNEIHITANKSKCMCLDVRHLPGGRASDYVTHIMSALGEVTATYAKFKEISPAGVLTSIKSSITCTLTDRAIVNACVTRQLCEEFDSQLLQLNCNVHPLDSVARDSVKALGKLDARHYIKGHCLGQNGSATNLINAVSTLRFKDGTGDPLGFKNFLKEHDLPVGTFVRYVGNRLHVLFHLAGLLILHKDKLLDFIETSCTAAGKIRSCVLHDLRNKKIVVQLWALGMIGKVFTGPWMTRFYSSEMSNLELGPSIRCSADKVSEWIDCPSLLLQATIDVFGDSLSVENDNVLSALLSFPCEETDFQTEALHDLLSCVLAVLNRQLHAFIDGDYAQPSEDILAKAACAPSNNMASERNLALLDSIWRRAPNATAGFLSGKVRCRMNRTLDWLHRKDNEERKQLIAFSVKEARWERNRQFLDREVLAAEIQSRRRDVATERETRQRKCLVKSLNQALESKNVSSLDISDAGVLQRISLYVQDPSCLIGLLVIHTIGGKDWYGRFNSISPAKKPSYVLSYWMIDEAEANSVDFTVSLSAFFADAIMGNVVFL